MELESKTVEAKKTLPHNRRFVFAKNCTNDHGTFSVGDRARGSFSHQLVESYLSAGILVEVPVERPQA